MASAIRRKPQVTYKSPAADDHFFLTVSSTQKAGKKPTATLLRSESINSHPNTRPEATKRFSTTPPLPLFHPFGRLALSLPLLDPTRYGLPVVYDEDDHKRSARSRRPTSRLREAEEDLVPDSTTVSAIAAVAAREAKERASPRKRRSGGAKRKRKDVDDGDATYPAKKTRAPRGGVGVEDDLSIDPLQPTDGGNVETTPDVKDSATRRLTRSKRTVKRRDSSGSETTSITGIPGALVSGEDAAPNPKSERDRTRTEKEDGELSDGQNS